MAKNTKGTVFATLKVRKANKKNPLPGFTIKFDPAKIFDELISDIKPAIELALNKFLEKEGKAGANKLVVPFTNTLTGTEKPFVYSFNIEVAGTNNANETATSNDPLPLLKKIDGFVLELKKGPPTGPSSPHHPPLPAPPPPPGGSRVNTVTIKAPPFN